MLHNEFARSATDCLFHSRDTRYRSPFGAVTAGTAIHLRVCLPRALGCHAARVWLEQDGAATREWGMFWCGMEGDTHEWWECHIAPEVAGLYFYRFQLDTERGVRFLVRCPNGAARLSDTGGDRWQITVFSAQFTTPAWLAGGVFYQIFPDRFAADGEPKANVPADRVLRADWGGEPCWRPDAEGRVLNNDYFGGSLSGILQKLDYLKSLGITCLYLNPIFESHSNHRYDTADYTRVDPLLGNEQDLRTLCERAAERGIRVILDGVFSHTGADSRYFNRYGRYDEVGAYQSPESPYASWYTFRRFPDDYGAWWGFKNLPEVQECDPSFLEYITGEDGVVRRWLAAGAAGWRLDVADELPDEFLDALRKAARAEKPDALVLGEVWEDASTKQSYGHRRRYLLGDQLDSVMNYPFANAIYAFLGGDGAEAFFEPVMDILENYPPQVTRVLMNPLGTHDTARAITVLAGEPAGRRGRDWQAAQRLSPEQYAHGVRLLKLASVLQYCLPGVPCLYYGDEAGMQGYRDPFNRGCYPWGEENEELLSWYRALGALRRESPALIDGAFYRLPASDSVAAFTRTAGEGELLCAVNVGGEPAVIPLPEAFYDTPTVLGDGTVCGRELRLPPLGYAVLRV